MAKLDIKKTRLSKHFHMLFLNKNLTESSCKRLVKAVITSGINL